MSPSQPLPAAHHHLRVGVLPLGGQPTSCAAARSTAPTGRATFSPSSSSSASVTSGTRSTTRRSRPSARTVPTSTASRSRRAATGRHRPRDAGQRRHRPAECDARHRGRQPASTSTVSLATPSGAIRIASPTPLLKDLIEHFSSLGLGKQPRRQRRDRRRLRVPHQAVRRRDQPQAGEFYTPRTVVRLMVGILDPKEGETVYDPAAVRHEALSR